MTKENLNLLNLQKIFWNKGEFMKIKKILCLLILCGLCIFTITGCGSNSKATIINNENETENLTAKDLYKINNENEAKFKKYYVSTYITNKINS